MNAGSIDKIEKAVLLIISLVVFGLVFWLAALSPGLEGGMDSYNHYLIARFSWLHPSELLLDQWGKPLYNILASPFAQFGVKGLVVFNILLLIGSAWMAWLAARKLQFHHAWLAFVCTLASPLFFDNVISGLTEPLNAFLLIFIFYLFVGNRYTLGAIVTGFLPFARSEGYVIMFAIGIYLLVQKEYRTFFLLAVGSVVMNFVGWMVEGDPIWIYTTNPYIKYQLEVSDGRVNICGSGSLWHYVEHLRWMMGKTRLVLFITGSLLVVLGYLRRPTSTTMRALFFLAFGVYALYFSVHSIIWYKGLMGSCGYERVMVVIDPLAAILMAYALELFVRYCKGMFPRLWMRVVWLFIFLTMAWMLYAPYSIYGHKYPIDISDEQKLFVKAADWYNEQSYENRMKYFLYPYLNMLTGIDPKDHEHFTEIWSFDIKYAPVGSIVIWDGHFGPNEGKVPLEQLMSHPDFKLIKSFCPEVPFTTSNNYDFEIYVFERIGDKLLE
jgi:hypothetical protein